MIFSFSFEDFSLPFTTNTLIAILGLGILCSAVGFIFQTLAQKYTTATHTGLIFSLEPIFAAIFAVLILNESFTLKDMFGCSIVLLGLLIAQVNIESVSKYKNANKGQKRNVLIEKNIVNQYHGK